MRTTPRLVSILRALLFLARSRCRCSHSTSSHNGSLAESQGSRNLKGLSLIFSSFGLPHPAISGRPSPTLLPRLAWPTSLPTDTSRRKTDRHALHKSCFLRAPHSSSSSGRCRTPLSLSLCPPLLDSLDDLLRLAATTPHALLCTPFTACALFRSERDRRRERQARHFGKDHRLRSSSLVDFGLCPLPASPPQPSTTGSSTPCLCRPPTTIALCPVHDRLTPRSDTI